LKEDLIMTSETETEAIPNEPETLTEAEVDAAGPENDVEDTEASEAVTGEAESETREENTGAEPEKRFGELRGRLQSDGRWRPQWDALGIETFCERLEAGAREWFEQFLEHTPPVVPMEEMAGEWAGAMAGEAAGQIDGAGRTGEPAARRETMTPGGAVSQDSMQLHRATAAYCESHPELDYATALRRVAAGG
jgi:hypothetical protein